MINHIWSVLCQRSVVDSESNNISLIDVFEKLEVNLSIPDSQKELKKINVPVKYEIVSLWDYDEVDQGKKISLQVNFKSPSGKTEKILERILELPHGKKRLRDRINVHGIVVEDSGRYFFQVNEKKEKDKNYKVISTLPLEIVVNKSTSN
ncbi:hypothetical protein HY468_05540 [Candidatus Roizmanbacteria bacterium]|nr:hypothetical protein [Candidatus Roizmanbacteria bacterium]